MSKKGKRYDKTQNQKAFDEAFDEARKAYNAAAQSHEEVVHLQKKVSVLDVKVILLDDYANEARQNFTDLAKKIEMLESAVRSTNSCKKKSFAVISKLFFLAIFKRKDFKIFLLVFFSIALTCWVNKIFQSKKEKVLK